MGYSRDYQSSSGQAGHRFIQALNDSLQEVLYSHIDPFFRQWLKTLHNMLITIAALAGKLTGQKQVTPPEKLLSVTLSADQRLKLSSGEETELIEGFISKKGRTFSAYLKMTETGELIFRFPEREKKAVPEQFMGVQLSAEQQEILKSGQETGLIQGLKGRRGIPFNAFLQLDSSGDIKMRFEERGNAFIGSERKAPDQRVSREAQPGNSQPGQHELKTQQAQPESSETLPPELKTGQQKSVSPEPWQPDSLQQQPPQQPLQPELKTGHQKTVSPEPVPQQPQPQPPQQPQQQLPVNGLPSELRVYGKKLDSGIREQLLSQGKTGLIDGFQTSTGKFFSARLEWKEEKLSIHIHQRQLEMTITMVPKKVLSAELTDQNRKLLQDGKSTGLVRDMVSPSGIHFDGWLKFNQAHRLTITSAERSRELFIPDQHTQVTGKTLQLSGKVPRATGKGMEP